MVTLEAKFYERLPRMLWIVARDFAVFRAFCFHGDMKVKESNSGSEHLKICSVLTRNASNLLHKLWSLGPCFLPVLFSLWLFQHSCQHTNTDFNALDLIPIDGFHGAWLHFRRAKVGVCV